jgi:hypothetical protein
VVGIVIWSLVFCLLGGLLALGLGGIGFRILDIHGFPVISLGGFIYKDADEYSVGNATVTDGITDLTINWAVGNVTVIPSEGDSITITEDYRDGSDADRLRWRVKDGKLTIQFRESTYFGSFESLSKDLTVAVPTAMLESMGDVQITVASGNVTYTGNADELSLDTVEGSLTVTGDIGDLEVEAVDGNVTFRGGVRRGDLDCVDADVTMYLDMAAELNFDHVDGNVTLYLSDEIAGFSTEMDLVGGSISLEGFDGAVSDGNRSARWGDGSLRIRVDGVDCQLNIKKQTSN